MKRVIYLTLLFLVVCFSCRDTPKSENNETFIPLDRSTIKQSILAEEEHRLILQLQQSEGVKEITVDSIELRFLHNDSTALLYTTWIYNNAFNKKKYYKDVMVVEILDITVDYTNSEILWKSNWKKVRDIIQIRRLHWDESN